MSSVARSALSIWVTAVALSACGGSPASTGMPSATVGLQARALAMQGHSWMAPEAKSENLLYVTNRNSVVTVYAYPQGKLVGRLTGFGNGVAGLAGECTDPAGNVWIVDPGQSRLVEFAHAGTTPIATLSTNGDASSCAVDPTTGNLAVTTLDNDLLVYAGAQGSPSVYGNPFVFGFTFCAYDPTGNLYADGFNLTGNFMLAELPKGAISTIRILVTQRIKSAGAVQADGNDIAIGDVEGAAIYQFSISGSSATLVGTTPLSLPADALLQQFVIQQGDVVAALYTPQSVRAFNYPAGGSATQTIGRGVRHPFGVAISNAPQTTR